MTTIVTEPPSAEARAIADEILGLHRMSNSTRAQLLRRIAEFDQLNLALSFGAVSTAAWLERDLHLKHSTAYEYVSVAVKLMHFQLLFHCFADGAIDYTTVRYLLRYINHDNEAELVALATKLCFSELQRILAGCDPEDNEEPDEPFIRTFIREDGMLSLHGLLPAVVGEQLKAALKIAQLANYGIDDAEVNDESEGATEAVAVAETQEEPETYVPRRIGDILPPSPVVEEQCPSQQVEERRPKRKLSLNDILGPTSRYGPPPKDEMYAAFLTMINMVRTNSASALRNPGAQVTIMLTEDGKAWMPSNPQVPSKVLESYVSNAMMRCHLLDSQGLTLHVGRQQRFATDGQIQALLAVWGHQCAMPGCTHSRFIEIHHIREWAEGGATDVDNLIPLCSSCHSKVSHGLAEIRARGSAIEFSFIDGSRFLASVRGLPERVESTEVRDDLTFA